MAVTLERMEIVEERVDRLESPFGQFMTQTGMALRRIDRSVERIEATVAEMKAESARDREESAKWRVAIDRDREKSALDREESAKWREAIDRDREESARDRTEMKAESARDREESARFREESAWDREESARFREESARDREESARFREESARDRAEMKTESARDREESARFRARSEQDSREMNKRWGELANKMGTLVEDIIGPSLRRMGREEFGCGEEQLFSSRISLTRSDDPKLRREFDALYVGSRAVLLNETKSTARPEYAREFVAFVNSGEFGLYFPEFRELPIVPVFSSLQIHPDLVTYLTRNGIYAVAMGEDVMQILNLAELRPESAEK